MLKKTESLKTFNEQFESEISGYWSNIQELVEIAVCYSVWPVPSSLNYCLIKGVRQYGQQKLVPRHKPAAAAVRLWSGQEWASSCGFTRVWHFDHIAINLLYKSVLCTKLAVWLRYTSAGNMSQTSWINKVVIDRLKRIPHQHSFQVKFL